MEARRESPRVVLKRSVLPAPAPVLSFVLTVFLASLVGTFTAKGFHQTLVDLEFFGELNTNHPLTTAPHGRELEVRGQSGDAQESVSNQISANGEQPGGATNATGNATSSSTSSASANTSKTIAVEISPVSLWPLPLSVSRGNWSLALSSHFRILPKRGLPALVSKAAVRLTSSLLRKHQAGFKRWFSGRDLPMLQVLHIRIHQPDGSRSYVQALGTNESYSLRINYSPGSQPTAKLDVSAFSVLPAFVATSSPPHNLTVWMRTWPWHAADVCADAQCSPVVDSLLASSEGRCSSCSLLLDSLYKSVG